MLLICASYEWACQMAGRHLTPVKAMFEEAIRNANVRTKQKNDQNVRGFQTLRNLFKFL